MGQARRGEQIRAAGWPLCFLTLFTGSRCGEAVGPKGRQEGGKEGEQEGRQSGWERDRNDSLRERVSSMVRRAVNREFAKRNRPSDGPESHRFIPDVAWQVSLEPATSRIRSFVPCRLLKCMVSAYTSPL